jgi:hypothetical protein
MGVNVAAIVPASTTLFELCRKTSWPQLAERTLLLQLEKGLVTILKRSLYGLSSPAIVIPMRPFTDQLQAAWADTSAKEQLRLTLPPTIVSRSAREAGA